MLVIVLVLESMPMLARPVAPSSPCRSSSLALISTLGNPFSIGVAGSSSNFALSLCSPELPSFATWHMAAAWLMLLLACTAAEIEAAAAAATDCSERHSGHSLLRSSQVPMHC